MLDPILLRTFLVIAQGNSFSETSRKLSMRQSTVSDHVRRLEQCLGRQLFVRDTHSVALTPEGEGLISFAQTIIETSERAERHFAGQKLRGRVRFGASEDVVVSWLASVLASFTRDHPEVDLEFTIALSSTLTASFDAGDLDVVLCKRWPGEERGDLAWRDQIVWVGATPDVLRPDVPVPLILYPPPSITRSIALTALGHAAVPWRIACTSDSLNGIIAAARAGLGVATLARKLVPEGLCEIAPEAKLPTLGALDFILLRTARAAQAPAAELSAAIAAKGASF
jgi:DNA-binding transcriptional LysR family regulator